MTTASAPAPTARTRRHRRTPPPRQRAASSVCSAGSSRPTSRSSSCGAPSPASSSRCRSPASTRRTRSRNLALISTIGAFAAMIAQPIAGHDLRPHALAIRPPCAVDGRGRPRRRPRARRHGARERRSCRSPSRSPSCRSPTTSRRARSAPSCPTGCRTPPAAPSPRSPAPARMFGALGGQIVGSMLRCDIAAAYMLLAGIALVVITLFVVFNPDHSSRDQVERAVRPRRLPRHVLGQPGQAPRLLLGLHGSPAALHRLLRRHRATSCSSSPTTSASATRPSSRSRCSASSASSA